MTQADLISQKRTYFMLVDKRLYRLDTNKKINNCNFKKLQSERQDKGKVFLVAGTV